MDTFLKNVIDTAVKKAEKAAKAGEIPVCAVIFNPERRQIVASAVNRTERDRDPTAHAEILAIKKACRLTKQTRLNGYDMYVTLEPCTMCAAAISFARINHLYFGAYDEKGGAVANGVRFYEQPTCHHRPQVTGGISEAECSRILKDFFKKKRTG